jgi:hypothetical protein
MNCMSCCFLWRLVEHLVSFLNFKAKWKGILLDETTFTEVLNWFWLFTVNASTIFLM